MINFDLEKKCYGCRACESACPKQAISMELNSEGFLMPVVNTNLCINCGLCKKACPHLSPVLNEVPFEQRKTFAAYSLDLENKRQSASGGIFKPIAEWVITHGGYVCGCVWNENLEAEHIITQNLDDIIRMQGSKYVQSDTKNCFQKIRDLLKKEYWVLFTGTPCQVGGLLSFVGENDCLITLALLCEGTPSPLVWKKNIEYIEKKYKSKLTNVRLRHKTNLGWQTPIVRYEFRNHRPIQYLSFANDAYVKAFVQGLYWRKSCYNCAYKGNGYNADFMIGDFWGAPERLINKSGNIGLSVLIFNSNRSEKLWTQMDLIFYTEKIQQVDFLQCNRCVLASKPMPENRQKFFDLLKQNSFDKSVSHFLKNDYFLSFIKKACYHLKLFQIAKRIQRLIRGSSWKK